MFLWLGARHGLEVGYAVRGRWAANVWFMIPIHYLRLAMMAMVREFVSSQRRAQRSARVLRLRWPRHCVWAAHRYSAQPPSRADEADATLRQLDRALQAIDAVEERFRQMPKASGSARRARVAV